MDRQISWVSFSTASKLAHAESPSSWASESIEETQLRWAEAEMHRLRGTLLLSRDGRAAAEESYREAIAVAQRQSAKFWELRAATDLARLWRDQGKRTEARDLLAPIYN
jgi:predicted ATPase